MTSPVYPSDPDRTTSPGNRSDQNRLRAGQPDPTHAAGQLNPDSQTRPDPAQAAGRLNPDSPGRLGPAQAPGQLDLAQAAGQPDPDQAGVSADPDSPGKRTFTPDFLTELFRNPLDPGYADAAARKAREGEPTGARRWVSSGSAALTLAMLGFLLVVAYQQTMADEPARSKARAELIAQVQNRRDGTAELQQRVDRLGDEVADLRERELGGATAARLEQLEAATGLAPVRGSGAKITVGDGPTPINPVTGERNTVARVKDTDLQLATNALWSRGAEAIAINGERLTATATIRQAGEAILVDQRPVTTPYEIVAIGPDELAEEFQDGYAGRFFKELARKYGMSFDSADVKNVTLAAATELKLRVAEPSAPPPAPSGSPGISGSATVGPETTATNTTAAAPRTSSSEGGR
jgi:uncharacterized protein YlxW (UPF0749 family)